MRMRLLAFLPLAGLFTFLMLLSASSLVSALERSIMPPETPREPLRVSRYETVCEGLFRQLHALSHEVTVCAEQPSCEGSPLLCPEALDDEIDHAYRRLRTALHEQCDFPLRLIDYAWQGPSDSIEAQHVFASSVTMHSEEGLPLVEEVEVTTCGGGRHDWLEAAASGEAEPARYFF